MLTVRHLEREWNASSFGRLSGELLAARGERVTLVAVDATRPVFAAAITLIRLDEVGQIHVPLAEKLVHILLAKQSPDGSWHDAATTALVVRALRTAKGHGVSIDRGIAYLAALQQPDGLWAAQPANPPADPATSAWILFQLGPDEIFRNAVRFAEAVVAVNANEAALPPDVRKLFARVHRRFAATITGEPTLAWS